MTRTRVGKLPIVVVPALLFLAIGAIFFLGLSLDDEGGLPSSLIGKAAPRLEPEQLGSGQPPTNDDLAVLDVKLLNFWASWCPPCRVEHPSLEQLDEAGIQIFGVNYKDNPDAAISFLEELGNPFQKVGADRNGRVAIEWGVYGVPETFVLDRTGTVLLRHAGPITRRVLEDRIIPVLNGESQSSPILHVPD